MFIVSKKWHNTLASGITAVGVGIGLFAISLTQVIPQMIAAGEMQRAEVMSNSFGLAGLDFMLCVWTVALLRAAKHWPAVRHSKVYYAFFFSFLLIVLFIYGALLTAGRAF